jgi:hypothetical protein
MPHPAALQIEDLQSINFDLIDLNIAESARVLGGYQPSGTTADGVGPNEVGGPYTGPVFTDPSTITADGVGPNEVGGPFTAPVGPTQATGENGGPHRMPQHRNRRRHRNLYW